MNNLHKKASILTHCFQFCQQKCNFEIDSVGFEGKLHFAATQR